MKPHKEQALRCAIYTRKSSEEGLEQDFNSLHAQSSPVPLGPTKFNPRRRYRSRRENAVSGGPSSNLPDKHARRSEI
jgi:hypothetical protein